MENNQLIFSARSYPSPNSLVKITEIVYWSCGLRVKGLLAQPKKGDARQGILYLRGGMGNIGMVRPARIAQLASQGFSVFAPFYRGNRGGEGRDTFAGEDRYDAVNGVDVLRKYCPGPIHVFSFSRGGIMAFWVGILRQDITSIVSWAGVLDPVLTYEERVDMRRMMKRVIGGTPTKVPERYEQRNPLLSFSHLTAKVLLIHGVEDEHVSIEHAKKAENRLRTLHKYVETWYFPDEKHAFPNELNRKVVENALHWMRKMEREENTSQKKS
ncbi:alpha/beta hydrolase family protein [Paenisporosarcina cavernae]|uniref:S9 family peptidase n=1 Tax=Paenisporosarcina cavernae TaxID=2320858 RepID=A0A385YWJ6_9BACL|nr:prolyl oligopeptidase family serine peptidase [Paenisporosarcina cavernae]AYC29913.1 S9 family peptidase [Paenisporosarcina cavernae]